VNAFAVLDGIAYWSPADGASSGTIMSVRRHDLDTDTALSDLYTVTGLTSGEMARTASGHPGDILTLSDGTFVTWYRNFTTEKDYIIHVSAAGALLHSFEYDWSVTLRQVNHLSYSPDGPSKIMVWVVDNTTAMQELEHLTLATGAKTTEEYPQYNSGVTIPSGVPGIGSSLSCAIMTIGFSFEEPEEEREVSDDSMVCPCPDKTSTSTPTPHGEVQPAEELCIGGGTVELLADLPGLEACWAA
jgi:hypothetical protein